MTDIEQLKLNMLEVIPDTEASHQAVADATDMTEIIRGAVTNQSLNKNNWPDWLKEAEKAYLNVVDPQPEPEPEDEETEEER